MDRLVGRREGSADRWAVGRVEQWNIDNGDGLYGWVGGSAMVVVVVCGDSGLMLRMAVVVKVNELVVVGHEWQWLWWLLEVVGWGGQVLWWWWVLAKG